MPKLINKSENELMKNEDKLSLFREKIDKKIKFQRKRMWEQSTKFLL